MRTDICAMASLSLMTMSIASTSAAQTVAGRVLDRQSKRPLREVTVVLLADTGKSTHAAVRATTDSLGIFYLIAPSPGVYQLLFATANDTLLSGYVALAQDEVAQREFLLDTHLAEPAYFEFQVTRQVQPSPNNQPPRYPEALRRANIQGEVLVQFIVDTTGKPEMNTYKVLRSTNVEFLMAVRSALPDYEFTPAMILDRKVPQVVQMPFHFCINGGNPFARPDTGRLWVAPPLRPGVCP
jgi:TonB family protein